MTADDSAEFLVTYDGSGHDYVIPADQDAHWQAWIGSDEWGDGRVPSYATRIDGGRVIFTGWRIGRPR